MYYNRRIYDIASKYHHRLLSLDEALALCKGREEEFFSALQDIGELTKNMKQYYIMKNTSNTYYSVESFRWNLSNTLKKIADNINAGDIIDINVGTAKFINEIFNNKTLRAYLQVAKLADNIKDNKFIISKPITTADIKADDIQPVETPTTDRCIELYYEYIGKGDMEKANAMYNIITYKNDENQPLN